jgi:Tfp pilus assembly protein PilE
MGLVAQMAMPIPDDLKTWPVTAMLVLLVIICLAIIAYQSRANSMAMVKAAEALTKMTERLEQSERRSTSIAGNLDTVVAELRARPCIRDRQ